MLVGIDDDAVGRFFGGQVVVGNDDFQAQGRSPRHARHAGDAVVHRQQQVRAGRRRRFGDFGCQPVAVFKAVRHHKIRPRTHGLQAFDAYRAGSCAVGVVVGDNQDVFLFFDCVGQSDGCSFAVFQQRIRQQGGKFVQQLVRPGHVAGGAQAGDQRVGTGGNQGLAGLGIDGTDLDFGGHGAVSDGGKKGRLYSGIKRAGRFGGGCSAFEGVFDERPSEKYISDGLFVIGRRLGIRVRKYINPQIPVIPLRFRALQIVEHLQAVHHKIFSNLYLGGDGWVFPEM